MEGTEAVIPSPEDFAKTLKDRRYTCKTCDHPARKQMERAIENGTSYNALAQWLQTFFPEEQRIPSNTIAYHFRNGHHKRS